MKKKIVILIVLVSLLLTVPALAKGERTGEKIGLFAGDSVFAAGEPFHIDQGWSFTPPDDRPKGGQFDFRLEVDGEYVTVDFTDRSPEQHGQILWLWVYNFPDGTTGAHTFTGHWFSSCGYAVDHGLLSGPCAKRSEQVEALTVSITVSFE